MYVMCCYVKFEGIKALTTLLSFEAEMGWDTLTNTASIRLPRVTGLNNKPVREFFKKGQAVEVRLGYDNVLYPVFAGYVSEVAPTDGSSDTVLKLSLEDEMWRLKQKSDTWSWRSVSLRTLLATIATGYALDAVDAQLGALTAKAKTPAKVLADLKERYGLRAYFAAPDAAGGNAANPAPLSPPLLRVGYVYSDHAPKAQHVAVLYGPKCNVINNKLEFATAEDTKIKVKAINTLPNNKTETYDIGPEDGAERTLHYYNQPDFRTQAQKQYEQMRFDGYRGSLTMMGIPRVLFGDEMRIVDPRNPDREGVYFVDKVGIKFDLGGYSQEVFLGKKLQSI